MAERPGFMVYFDLFDTLKDFTTEEIGQLFLAMLEYGVTGTLPEFEDRGMRTLWRSIQQKLDRDNTKYQETVEARQYATFCREFKKKNGEGCIVPSMKEWKRYQLISNDDFDIQQVTTTETVTEAETKAGAVKGNGDLGERGNNSNIIEEFERRRQKGIRELGFDW